MNNYKLLRCLTQRTSLTSLTEPIDSIDGCVYAHHASQIKTSFFFTFQRIISLKMFFAVFLSDLNENRVVKAQWVKTIPILNMIKKSVNRNIKHLIFWSDANDDVPNFNLPISKNSCDRACYVGHLLGSTQLCWDQLGTEDLTEDVAMQDEVLAEYQRHNDSNVTDGPSEVQNELNLTDVTEDIVFGKHFFKLNVRIASLRNLKKSIENYKNNVIQYNFRQLVDMYSRK